MSAKRGQTTILTNLHAEDRYFNCSNMDPRFREDDRPFEDDWTL